jgi:adenylate cyclase
VKIYFPSFRSRLLCFVLGLVVLIQVAVLLAVNTASVSEARRTVDDALGLTAKAFARSLEVRERILREKARLLSADFAFKEAAATGDHGTLLSVLENHRGRIDADVMMLVDLEYRVLADTLAIEARGTESSVKPLIDAAARSEHGEASAILFIENLPYQLVVVPLFTPDPTAWIAIGFAIRDSFARELEEETRSQVSLLRRDAERWSTFCSTLTASLQSALEVQLSRSEQRAGEITTLDLDGADYVSFIVPLQGAKVELVAVLQRSLQEALAPYRRLRAVLLGVFAVGVGLSLVGVILLATRVTRPVAVLADGARRIGSGNYTQPIDVAQRDELGLLAASFNQMMKGLIERDQVREMLGRVVSPQIAEELLSKEVELGGEERTVSVFFTDVRGFTTLATREEPQRLVKVLNIFLTGASAAIEGNGGVVEEFMGDGVKALFGAPVQHEDDAARSVAACLELQESMASINAKISELGAAPLEIGIGVHTGVVVTGKMGSLTRLKYTAVGDGVNLASRLEGLTQRYGVSAIVSEATRAKCTEVCFRELDRVRVRGRDEPVRIFEPMGRRDAITNEQFERIERHHKAQECYRARDWDGAEAIFRELASLEPKTLLFALYLERIAAFRREPPGPDWDGTQTFVEK